MLFPRTRKAAWLPLSRRAASGSARQIFVRRARRESLEAIAALLILWAIRPALASSLPAMHPLPQFHQHLPFTLARDQSRAPACRSESRIHRNYVLFTYP